MLLGVLAFDVVFPRLPAWGIRSFPQSMTLPPMLDISYGALAITLGVLVLMMVGLAHLFDPAWRRALEAGRSGSPISGEWGFATTGVLAGLIILAATAQGQYLGISGGFASLIAYAASVFGTSLNSVPALDDTTAWRAALVVGLFPGATISALTSASFRNVPVTPLWQSTFPSGVRSRAAAVFVGGFFVMFGALLGGGCTTGAFMAGFPTLSIGSFAMGMTFFAVGMGAASLLYWGRWRKVAEAQTRPLDLATD
jgi:hypothetical protein